MVWVDHRMVFTMEIMCQRTIESMDIGDVSLGQFRDTLLTELEKINEKLDALIQVPLKTAVSLVKSTTFF